MNRQAYKDKLDSVTRVKETAREEKDAEVERVRARAADEANREAERLKAQIREKDAEIQRLRDLSNQSEMRERDVMTQAEKHDKTVIHEINDDCKKTALLLGVTPRKAVPGGRRNRDTSPTRSAVTAALVSSSHSEFTLLKNLDFLKNQVPNIQIF